jgi:Ca-activated chloride channel family protein
MPQHHALARAPEETTFDRRSRTLSAHVRRCGYLAIFPLLVTLGCSRATSPQAIAFAPPSAEDGTGTRAKGEQALLPKDDQPSPALPPASPEVREHAPPPPAQRASQKSLALSGVGEGGGGYGIGRAGGSRIAKKTGASSAPAATQLAQGAVVAVPEQGEFHTESYSRVNDNPFLAVKHAPLSTFSVDVDTASYSNMRRFVESGSTPPPDSIRVEEWINYFTYEAMSPAPGEPIAVSGELTDCPWAPDHRLLRVALATRPIAQEAVPPRNLVFLIDVSGSMADANKLPLLKRGLAMLAHQLRPEDSVAMVVYAGASGLVLPPTSGAEQEKILGALASLESGGSTNGAAGIELAYKVAASRFQEGGINRVILASDGDFNVGITSEGALERLIEEKRKTGVFLTVLGFGEGNLKDATMEKLADKGNGQYAYIDSIAEARKVLVRESGATLVTVAKDVKLQLEWNPSRVKSYRLVGYENRLLAAQDFNDDKKDAGEMGAGHHVTAFYEIEPNGAAAKTAPPAVDPLKYQSERAPSAAASSGELVTVKIRYKPPSSETSLLLSHVVADRPIPLAQASDHTRFGAAVAQYGLTLRGAPGFSRDRLGSARALAASALGRDVHGERREFLALMDRAARASD